MGLKGAAGGARGLVWSPGVRNAEAAPQAPGPRPRAKHSPSEVGRRNTITREMGPSCCTVHVCKISVWKAGTQGPVPQPWACPQPGPHPHLHSSGPREPHAHSHSGSPGRRAAATSRGCCRHRARGHWWEAGRRWADRLMSQDSTLSLLSRTPSPSLKHQEPAPELHSARSGDTHHVQSTS